MADAMSIDINDIKHDSDDSLDSGAEGDGMNVGGAHGSSSGNAQDNQPAKRKGGRKPIYATSEERKQRNRQAQAAFRERRTEYIKQLEETIRVHEQNLHSLQTAHRHAADECLMLRYKNSLLERILLEKGIDVQTELCAKTGSPNLGPTHTPQNMVQPPPLPRSIINRHHARRSHSSIAPKVDMGGTALPGSGFVGINPGHPTPTSVGASPKSRPTPSSHSASPAASTSVYGQSPAASGPDAAASIRALMTAPAPAPPPPPPPSQIHPPSLNSAGPLRATQLGSPIPGMSGPAPPKTMQQRQRQHAQLQQQPMLQYQQLQHPQHLHQQRPSQPPQRQQHQQHMPHQHSMQQQQSHHVPLPSPHPATPRSAGGVGSASFFTLPGFQNHFDQLKQEYSATEDLMEDPAEVSDPSSGPNPYPANAFPTAPPPPSLASPANSVAPNVGGAGVHGAHSGASAGTAGSNTNGYPSMTQLLDPALDWDPFGLSASMQFPTHFSFDTSNTR